MVIHNFERHQHASFFFEYVLQKIFFVVSESSFANIFFENPLKISKFLLSSVRFQLKELFE